MRAEGCTGSGERLYLPAVPDLAHDAHVVALYLQLLLVHPGTHTDNVAVEGLRQRCLDRSVRSLLLVDYPYSLSLSLCVSAFGN